MVAGNVLIETERTVGCPSDSSLDILLRKPYDLLGARSFVTSA
jgi:hypothetical protein